MPTSKSDTAAPAEGSSFRVLDAMDAPHGGRIVRLRLQAGEPPTVKALKGARLRAKSPDGSRTRMLRVTSFAVFGGHPTDERIARTGRVDLHVAEENGDPEDPVTLKWEVTGPLRDR